MREAVATNLLNVLVPGEALAENRLREEASENESESGSGSGTFVGIAGCGVQATRGFAMIGC